MIFAFATLGQANSVMLEGLAVLACMVFALVQSVLYAAYSKLLTKRRLGRSEQAFGIVTGLVLVIGLVLPMVLGPRGAFVLHSIAIAAMVYAVTRQRLLAAAPLAGLAIAGFFFLVEAPLLAWILWHVPVISLTVIWREKHPPVLSPRSPSLRNSPAPASPCPSPEPPSRFPE